MKYAYIIIKDSSFKRDGKKEILCYLSSQKKVRDYLRVLIKEEQIKNLSLFSNIKEWQNKGFTTYHDWYKLADFMKFPILDLKFGNVYADFYVKKIYIE